MIIKLILLLVLFIFDFIVLKKYLRIDHTQIFNTKISKIKEMCLFNSSYYKDTRYNYIVVISVSNGLKQAKCFSSKKSSLKNAFNTSILKANEYINKYNFFPKFVKIDISNDIKNISSPLFDYITYKNSFKYGIYFNINKEFILLKEEINSNQIIDYLGMKINKDKLNKYLHINIGSIPNNISLFTTIAYFCDENNDVYKISNNNDNLGFRDIENVTVSLIDKIIGTSKDYLNNIILDSGKFIYCYYALNNYIFNKYNEVRHAGSCWALAETMKNDDYNEKLNFAFNYILKKLIYMDNNTAFIDSNGIISLGTQGLFLTALSTYLQKKTNDKLLKIAIQLGNGIIYMQNSDGQLRHILKSSDFSTLFINKVFYYNGESVLGLIKLYEVSKNEKYLNAAKSSMDYFIRNNFYEKEDHWIIYCSNEITKYIDNINYYQLGIKSIKDSFYKLYYKDITNPTDFEKLIQIYELYTRMRTKNINTSYLINFEDNLLKTIKFRAKFQLNSYVFPEVGMYFKKPSRAIGAFYVRRKNYRIRNDDIQHSIVGYLYFLKNYKQIYSN